MSEPTDEELKALRFYSDLLRRSEESARRAVSVLMFEYGIDATSDEGQKMIELFTGPEGHALMRRWWTRHRRDDAASSSGPPPLIERLYDQILAAGGDGVTRSTLLEATGIRQDTLRRYLISMRDSGYVLLDGERVFGLGKTGKPTWNQNRGVSRALLQAILSVSQEADEFTAEMLRSAGAGEGLSRQLGKLHEAEVIVRSSPGMWRVVHHDALCQMLEEAS